MNKLLIVIVVLLIGIFGVSAFIAFRIWQNPSHTKSPIPTPSKTPNLSSQKIAYVKDKRLWVIDVNGENKKVITGGTGVYADEYIPDIAWRNRNTVSFIDCFGVCKIFTNNLTDDQDRDEISLSETIDGTTGLALAWNHAGDKLAYLYRFPDGQMKLDMKTTGGTNTIKNFFAGPGRGGSLDDDVSINFSPDDKYILVTNTLTVGNPQDKNTIWVLEVDSGKEIISIPISDLGWPTQAIWTDNEFFVYKQGPALMSRSLDSDSSYEEAVLGKFYNPVYDKFTYTNYYWVETETLPYVGGDDFGRGHVEFRPFKLIDGYFKPQVLKESYIALKAKPAEGDETIIPFTSAGLSSINLQNEVTDLDTGEISQFAVSP